MSILWTAFEVLGTIAFTLSGALVGISRRLDIFGVFILAVTSAVGGEIVRDILAGRIPAVLREEVYGLPTIVGGLLYYGIVKMNMITIASYMAFSVVFIIRIWAIKEKWSLPKVHHL